MIRCDTCLIALQIADREDNNCPSCKDYIVKKTKAIQQMLDTQAEWKEVVKKANAKALAKHQKFQEGMSENPIYPIDRYDSDAEFFDRPIDWQEQQAKDMEELEQLDKLNKEKC